MKWNKEGQGSELNLFYFTWNDNHRIQTHRRSTHPKERNRCHAMIRHQNADAMVLASALMRGIPPSMSAILNIIRGANAYLISALARTMVSAF